MWEIRYAVKGELHTYVIEAISKEKALDDFKVICGQSGHDPLIYWCIKKGDSPCPLPISKAKSRSMRH